MIDQLVPLVDGVYCISATTLQQVYSTFLGGWAEGYERTYQRLLTVMSRYGATAGDPAARAALLAGDGARYWQEHLQLLDALRFARLCAALRHRPPDGDAGYSILIFDLTDQEVQQALYGPPAEVFPQPRVSQANSN